MQTFCSTCQEPRSSLADPYCRRCGALATQFEPISLLRSHSTPPAHVLRGRPSADLDRHATIARGRDADAGHRPGAFGLSGRLAARASVVILAGAALSAAAFSAISFRRATAADRRAHAAEQRGSAFGTELDKASMELQLMSFALEVSNRERDALRLQVAAAANESNAISRPLVTSARPPTVSSDGVRTVLARCVPDRVERLLADNDTIAALAGGIIARAAACSTAGVAAAEIAPSVTATP